MQRRGILRGRFDRFGGDFFACGCAWTLGHFLPISNGLVDARPCAGRDCEDQGY
jgi:hypothetical protein